MKIFIYLCLSIHFCYSEIPPLQSIQGLLSNQNRIPQVIYGVPATGTNSNPQYSQPHVQYGVPNRDVEPISGTGIPKPPPSKVQNPVFASSGFQQQNLQNLQHLRPPISQQQYSALPTRLQTQQITSAHLNCDNFQNLQISRPLSQQQHTASQIQSPQIVIASQGFTNLHPPSPQQQYGAPNPSYKQPSLASNNQNFIPQTTYGTPNKVTLAQNKFKQNYLNTNWQSGNEYAIRPPRINHQIPDRFISQQLSSSSVNNGFAHQTQKPHSVYGSPNFAGLEPFDIKNQPSKFSQSFQQQNLNDYKTITKEALELYERVKNFPVTRNEAAGRQNWPPIDSSQTNSYRNQQTQVSTFYPTQQHLPLQKAANFLQQPQGNFEANTEYPNSESLPIREAANFRQLPQNAYLPPIRQQGSGEYPAGQSLPFRATANFRSLPDNFNNRDIQVYRSQGQGSRDAFKQVTNSAQSNRNSDREAKALGNEDVYSPVSTLRPPVITQRPLTSITQPPTKNNGREEDHLGQSAVLSSDQTGKHFYLIRPDGTFQKVTYNKIQEPSGDPGEYIANYYFKNIPPVADPLYNLNAPVIAIG